MKEICVVIPIYKSKLNIDEEFSVKRTIGILDRRPLFFVAPSNLDLSYYKENYPEVKVEFFEARFFKNIQAYSRLLLSKKFYKRFDKYEYMLIAQTDAIILDNEDKLDIFADMDYDYWGSPWEKECVLYPAIFKGMYKLQRFLNTISARCGNGGFCLRKITSMLEILGEHPIAICISKWHAKANEDVVLCYYLNYEKKYSLPTAEVAESFAVEQTASMVLERGGRPYAIHAYEKYLGNTELLKRYLR